MKANPLAVLGSALLVPAVLLARFDLVTPLVLLAGEALWLVLLRPPARALALRTVPVWFAVVPAATVAWLTAGPVDALAVALRIVAIALPGVAATLVVDLTALADACGQVLRLPAAPVLSALAALRLVGDLVDEWQDVALARRARGLPAKGLRAAPRLAFVLVVLALRRAVVLAEAMEARGLRAAPGTPRTWARPSRFGGADAALLVASALWCVLALAVGPVAG